VWWRTRRVRFQSTLIRPYLNFNGSLSSTEYIGKARTHSLEINSERRFSEGFNLTFSCTRAMAILVTGQ
jgi:hypothetical protein